MGCGDFQQIRLCEFHQATFSPQTGALTSGSFDLPSAIDVGGFKSLTVTVTVFAMTFGTGVTGVKLNGRTAAVNNDTYYGNTDESITLDAAVTSMPVVWIGKFEDLSRFWLPGWSVTGSPSGSTSTTLSCTIDIVARG